MASLTKGKTFANGELVTPQKLHELVDLGTVSGIVNADIAAGAAIADSKLAQITTANKVAQSAVTNLTTDLAGKAATSHTHTIANVTGLQTALDGKQASGSYAPATGIAPSAITGTAVVTTDSRLSDARTPTAHTHGNITNAGAIGATANLPVVTTTSGVLTTVPAGTAGQVLTSNGGTSAPSFQTLSATSTNANNLTGGSAGTVPYQSAAGTTVMLAAGTSGQVLRSNGTSAPSWLTLAASATTDTTNAANITTGTLPLARIPTGTTSSTVCVGNDSRLSNSRFPTFHTHDADQIVSGTLSNDRLFATSANAVNNLVLRDASGNFSAGTITAALSGNATNVSGTVAVANGGTGATTASTARTNLGLGNVATIDGTPGGASGSPSAGSAGKIVTRDSARGFFAGRVQVTSETLNYGLDSEVDIIPGNVEVIKGTGVAQTSPNLLLGYSYDSSSGVNFIKFWRNGFDIGAITQSGTTGVAYNTSSDYRLKTNIEPLTAAVARLLQIPVHRFNWLADPTAPKVDGFLAHEAQSIVPECVVGAKDEVDADGKPKYQGIDQSKLVPLLVAAVQELAGRVAALEAR